MIDVIEAIVKDERDWNYKQHVIIDTKVTQEDIAETLQKYADFQFNQMEQGRITKEQYWSEVYEYLEEHGIPRNEYNKYKWIGVSDTGQYNEIYAFVLIDTSGEEPEPVLSVGSMGMIGIKLKRQYIVNMVRQII